MTFLFYFILNKDTMIISKCVPLEISRKRFSDFLECEKYENLYLVGYDEQQNKKTNKKVKYTKLRELIQTKFEQQIGDVQKNFKSVQEQIAKIWAKLNDEQYIPQQANLNEIVFVDAVYDEDIGASIINLKNTLGCVEINGGGEYVQDYLLFDNPIKGTVTRVIVDNSGRYVTDQDGNKVYQPPTQNFVLYYGRKYDYPQEVLNVDVGVIGILQILHTARTDVIINTSYVPNIKFVEDHQAAREYIDDNNRMIDVTPDDNTSGSYDIDMKNEQAYMQFNCSQGIPEYTFWFSNPELGSVTYIVVTNDTSQNVTINYGKKYADQKDDTPDQIQQNYTYPVVDLYSGEKTVIQVFHSLSADIITKVTTLSAS